MCRTAHNPLSVFSLIKLDIFFKSSPFPIRIMRTIKVASCRQQVGAGLLALPDLRHYSRSPLGAPRACATPSGPCRLHVGAPCGASYRRSWASSLLQQQRCAPYLSVTATSHRPPTSRFCYRRCNSSQRRQRHKRHWQSRDARKLICLRNIDSKMI